MTKEQNDDLIKRARGLAAHSYGGVSRTLRELTDALEAATRVPVQGEPNDDREALRIAVGSVVRDVKNFPQPAQTRLLGEDMTTLCDALVDSLTDGAETRPGASKGPDFEGLIETIKQTGGSVQIAGVKIMPCDEYGRTAAEPDAETRGDYHEGLEEGIKIGRAERDAALAAIERVRAVLEVHPAICGVDAYMVREVHAALDRAPEPEWEYGVEVVSVNKHGDESWLGLFCGRGDEETARRATSEANGNEVQVVRRRKAGTWLPIEREQSDEKL